MAKPHLWMTTREQTQEPRRRPPVRHAAREPLPTARPARDDGCNWPAFRPCEGTTPLLHLLGGHSQYGITWRQIGAAWSVTKSEFTEPYERKEKILWQQQATKS
jgi:hypothetical protein